jgi:hypothetical protein
MSGGLGRLSENDRQKQERADFELALRLQQEFAQDEEGSESTQEEPKSVGWW